MNDNKGEEEERSEKKRRNSGVSVVINVNEWISWGPELQAWVLFLRLCHAMHPMQGTSMNK